MAYKPEDLARENYQVIVLIEVDPENSPLVHPTAWSADFFKLSEKMSLYSLSKTTTGRFHLASHLAPSVLIISIRTNRPSERCTEAIQVRPLNQSFQWYLEDDSSSDTCSLSKS